MPVGPRAQHTRRVEPTTRNITALQEVFIDQFDRLDDNLKDTLQADCNKFDAGLNIIAVRQIALPQ